MRWGAGMAWTPPKTWNDTRDRLNSANLNQFIRDNQLALRADAAALEQRVAAIEAAGFSQTFERSADISRVSIGRFVITDLAPPADTVLIDFDVRVDDRYWAAGPRMPYSVWEALPLREDPSANTPQEERWDFAFASGHADWPGWSFIAKGPGGVLGFGRGLGGSGDAHLYDQVAVRWFR